MIALIPYLLKVILCSTLLMGYYYIALRNKLFHQWNRFYLSAAVVLSIVVPCFSFNIQHTPEQASSQAIQMLQVITVSGEYEPELPVVSPSFVDAYGLLIGYGLASALLCVGFLLTLYRITHLIRTHANQQVGKLHLLITDIKGTPFSFFNYLFWNPSIDMDTETGQQIFKHEMVHIDEKHTLDKLFLQLVLIVFWCNPVFWLIRYELRMVHEFIADRKAVQNQDASALAAMILQAAYPKQFNQIINPFFNQSIKRRLLMLTKTRNPKVNYISRLLFIPLSAVIVLAFTIQTKEKRPSLYTGVEKARVVIDAGHGDMTVAIANTIRDLNTNPAIEIILIESKAHTDGDVHKELLERHKAKLFLSLHAVKSSMRETTKPTGALFEVLVPQPSSGYFQLSQVLGSSLVQQLSSIQNSTMRRQLRSIGASVLPQGICPSALIECVSLNHSGRNGFMEESSNQALIAQKILSGIELYLQQYLKLKQDIVVIHKEKPTGIDSIRRNALELSPIEPIGVDTAHTITLQSGDDLTILQLQSIPFAKLIQPDTDHTMISAVFSIEMGDNIYNVNIKGNEQPDLVKELMSKAKAADMIFVESRKALTKEGKEMKLPAIFYYIK